MLIILEGPDGGGKSVLAAKLAKDLNATVVHYGPYSHVTDPGQFASIYLPALRQALSGANVIMDRSWLSEAPYSLAFRGGRSRLLPAHQRMLERCAITAEATVINCLPSWETVLASYMSRQQSEYLKETSQLKQVWDWYHWLDEATDLPVQFFDRTEVDVPPLIAFPNNRGPGAGFWRTGKVALIVGDRTNTRRNDAETARVPFVSFSGLGCSGWLADLLTHAGIQEINLYWVNAFRPDGTPEDFDFVELLQPVEIFALGRRAAERLTGLGIKHVTAPHPQHHKRFHSARPYPLIKHLRKVFNDSALPS